MSEIKLYNGDCLIEMDNIPDKSVDMILCDLPYGTTACSWDIIIPFDKLWKQYNRIIKDNGAIVLFGQEPFSSMLRMSNLAMYKYDIYWEKEQFTNIMQVKRRVGKNIETISIFYSKQCTYNPQMEKYYGPKRTNKVKDGKCGKLVDSSGNKAKEYNDIGLRYPKQVWHFKRDMLKCNLHPTQKPIALLEHLIKTFSNEGDTILDNTMGSGSTGVACVNTNRNFIGIELNKEYFDIASNRISETQNKQKEKLF